MRAAFAMTGIGFLIIIGGLYLINVRFTSTADTSRTDVSGNATNTITMPLPDTLTLSSTEFLNNSPMPERYTCDGEGVHPPLSIEGVPEETRSLALIVHDPDVPKALKSDGNFDHWVLFNIPPATTKIASGAALGTSGQNSAGKMEYAAPCPPGEYEPSEHRYFFKLYALDIELPLAAGASRVEVENAMQGHVIAEAELVGTYKRK